MKSVYEQIVGHRSIRHFDETREVESDKIERVCTAALRTSSSGNMQSFSVIVTQDRTLREQLYPLHFHQEMVLQAPVLMTFCADFHRMRRWLALREALDNFDNFFSFMIAAIDATLASQSAALAAEAEGLGICYMGTTLASADKIGELLACPKNVIPVVGFSMGYAAENPPLRDRLPLDGIVHKNKYRDPSDAELLKIYERREIDGWNRYMNFPELKAKVLASGVKNLAQLYTKVKYTKESHEDYSKTLWEYIQQQTFGAGV